MGVFAIGVENALDAPVQRPQHPDAREHRRPSRRRDEHQGLHRCLPFGRGMLSLRKLRDVVAGILERDKLVSAGNGIGSSKGRDQDTRHDT